MKWSAMSWVRIFIACSGRACWGSEGFIFVLRVFFLAAYWGQGTEPRFTFTLVLGARPRFTYTAALVTFGSYRGSLHSGVGEPWFLVFSD